jgi:hypothetical protein
VIETVLIADTLALGRAFANELGLDRATTKVVSKPDQLRGGTLPATVRVIDKSSRMLARHRQEIGRNIMLCCPPHGTAFVKRADGDTRVVLHADPVIGVETELLTWELYKDCVEPDGTLRLDTAGEYRYRFVRAQDERVHIYERITG